MLFFRSFSNSTLCSLLSKYPPLKESWPLLKTNLIALFQGCYLPLLVEICLVVKEKTFSLNFCLTLLLFPYYSSWKILLSYYALRSLTIRLLWVYPAFSMRSSCLPFPHHAFTVQLSTLLRLYYPFTIICQHTVHFVCVLQSLGVWSPF